MPRFRKKTPEFTAYQLVGNAGETMTVLNWVASHGYPWLVGDATKPETLHPNGGKPGDPGMYIEPANGEVVILNGRTSQHATYGDWIAIDADDKVSVHKTVYFDATYEEVG